MKDTGVIRKIDELGRIVIPKELRRALGIRDGENMEIFVSNDGICLKKYSFISSINNYAIELVQLFHDIFGYDVILFNESKVIYSSFDLPILNYPEAIYDCYKKLDSYESSNIEDMYGLNGYFYGLPIILESDCIGYILIRCNNKVDNIVKELVRFLAKLIINPYDIS